MAYLIDSSSLIEAKDRVFCFDICPGFWDWLEQQNAAGNVFSIDRVFDELDKGNDALATWIRQRRNNFFLPVDATAFAEMSRISQWATTAYFTQPAQTEFLSGADPFLVAYALAHNHTVVTDEKFIQSEKKRIKIPAACHEFQVPCISPLEMLRTERVRFVLEISSP